MSKLETFKALSADDWKDNPVMQALVAQTHAALSAASAHTEITAQMLKAANESMALGLGLIGREAMSFSVDQIQQRLDDTQALMKASSLNDAASLTASQTTAMLQAWSEATRRMSNHWTATASAYLSLSETTKS